MVLKAKLKSCFYASCWDLRSGWTKETSTLPVTLTRVGLEPRPLLLSSRHHGLDSLDHKATRTSIRPPRILGNYLFFHHSEAGKFHQYICYCRYPLTLEWRRSRYTPALGFSRRLQIQNVQKADEGKYQCFVKIAGDPSRTYHVNVTGNLILLYVDINSSMRTKIVLLKDIVSIHKQAVFFKQSIFKIPSKISILCYEVVASKEGAVSHSCSKILEKLYLQRVP